MLFLSEREPAKFFKTPPHHNGFFIKSQFFFCNGLFQIYSSTPKAIFFYHHQLIFKARLQYYYQPPCAHDVVVFSKIIFEIFIISHTQSKQWSRVQFLNIFLINKQGLLYVIKKILKHTCVDLINILCKTIYSALLHIL